jgi:hypothetical protein
MRAISASCLDELLDPIDNVQVAMLIEIAIVARMEPTVAGEAVEPRGPANQ